MDEKYILDFLQVNIKELIYLVKQNNHSSADCLYLSGKLNALEMVCQVIKDCDVTEEEMEDEDEYEENLQLIIDQLYEKIRVLEEKYNDHDLKLKITEEHFRKLRDKKLAALECVADGCHCKCSARC